MSDNVFKKMFYALASVVGFIAAWVLRKILSDNGNRTESDTGGIQPTTSDSERADQLNQEAGDGAQRIFDIIERVKKRESEIKE